MSNMHTGLPKGVSRTVVRVVRLNPGVPLPAYQTSGAAGADVHACIDRPLVLSPGERVMVPTGLQFEVSEGFEIQVRSRSGLASKNGVFVINSPGTIDSDYRGEVKILLANIGSEAITIQPFDRIAQLVVSPVSRAEWKLESSLRPTDRAHGGFGSTGL